MLTPDGTEPTVVETECSSFCTCDRRLLLWLMVLQERRPPFLKAGERIMRGGLVYWIWVLFPLLHSNAQKSVAACSFSESFSPRGTLSFLLHFCSGKCRGSSCFSLTIKIKVCWGSAWACKRSSSWGGRTSSPGSAWGADRSPLLRVSWYLHVVIRVLRRRWEQVWLGGWMIHSSHGGGVLLLGQWCRSVLVLWWR